MAGAADTDDLLSDNNGAGSSPAARPAPSVGIFHIMAVMLLVGVTAGSATSGFGSVTTLWTVWWYGWLTCLSTGLGALPFACFQELPPYLLGASNAMAAGMMISASGNMIYESWVLPADSLAESGIGSWNPEWRLVLGLVLGLAFIIATKSCVDEAEDVHFENLHGMDAKKALVTTKAGFLSRSVKMTNRYSLQRLDAGHFC